MKFWNAWAIAWLGAVLVSSGAIAAGHPEAPTMQTAAGERMSAVDPISTASKEQVEPIDDGATAPPTSPLPDNPVPLGDVPKPEPATAPPPVDPVDPVADEDREQLLIEADRLYQQGRYEDAEFLYRKAKDSFVAEAVSDRPAPISDATLLPPAGQVYWREAEAGRQTNLITRVIVPLRLLVEQYPAFIPGHIEYARVLTEQEQPEEALIVLEQATALYPDEPLLVRARVEALAEQERWLEASIAARQFALLNPDAPNVSEFEALAAEHLDEFRSHMRNRLRGNAIANVFTGALGYALTGGLFGPLSAIETTVIMLRGEEAVGDSIARQATRQLDLVEDEAIVAYVNEIGQRLAHVAGRDEFEYEFYVVRDPRLNAFALPGGKIFVNAGAILKAQSEAELAGLLAHELSHAVLSHGFQLVTSGNVTANLLQLFPFGGYAANLVVLDYSRDMERQADALGTRILASSNYAADGLRNLMVTLDAEDREGPTFAWLSTHPDTDDRIESMEQQIVVNGYNRYAFEGIERFQQIQERVRRILATSDIEK